jgi:hypothetical protein
MKITPEFITELKANQVFVFGSNREGQHVGGAAMTAHKRFGAIWGKGNGKYGQSYAIDTMTDIDEMIYRINKFIDYAKHRPELDFLVTPIGCGIACYTPKEIAPLFKKAQHLENVYLPQSFWDILMPFI